MQNDQQKEATKRIIVHVAVLSSISYFKGFFSKWLVNQTGIIGLIQNNLKR